MTSAPGGLPVVYLRPGEIHVTDKKIVVVNVLGSCLSVTMHDAHLRLSAICHCLLPSCRRRKSCAADCPEKFRYVDCAVPRMAGYFERLGGQRRDITVKYFGAADLFMPDREDASPLSVGKQNSAMAEKIIRSEGLAPAAKDVGGGRSRKIYFYTATGDVLLKRLMQLNNPAVRW